VRNRATESVQICHYALYGFGTAKQTPEHIPIARYDLAEFTERGEVQLVVRAWGDAGIDLPLQPNASGY